MTDTLPSPFVYLDANPIAYALESPKELASALKSLFSIFRLKPGMAVTSELTLAEALPRQKLPDRHFFDLLIWSRTFDLRPVTRDVLIETAHYRRIARAGGARGAMPKLPDAIHVVTAVQAGCRAFLSSDRGIRLPDTMKLVRASKEAIEALAQEVA